MRYPLLVVGLVAVAVFWASGAFARDKESAKPGDKAAVKDGALKSAMFGAGCFWGVEETFRTLPGVKETAVGYAGGKTKDPTYKEVCTDKTGHAEVVHIEFDPAKTSYQKLLDVFFSSHNPMTLNRQGPDVGTQYRSVIFYYSPEQKKLAEATIARLTKEKRFPRPIVTALEPAPPFYMAEDYHQKYLMKRGKNACHY